MFRFAQHDNHRHTYLMRLTMTNYLDVISSWCYWAIPAWQELRERYRDRVDFQWRIALMDKKGLPPTRAHTEWYYKRSGILMRSPRMLSASWVEPNATEYLAPNCVAEAADLDLDLLLQCAQSTAVETRVRKSTADFHALQVTQRPTFVIDSPIG